jgi:hypothetical protein
VQFNLKTFPPLLRKAGLIRGKKIKQGAASNDPSDISFSEIWYPE